MLFAVCELSFVAGITCHDATHKPFQVGHDAKTKAALAADCHRSARFSDIARPEGLLFGGLPAPTLKALSPVRPSTLIYDRNGRLLYQAIAGEGTQTPLAFEQIPAACWQATVAVEDSRFFQHPGVDPLAIARAAWQNWRGGTVISGASTLTQQLAKNTLLAPEERYEQTLRRKLREAWLAVQIELRFSKNDILALYLNQVYYGNFAYGLEAASQAYFGKSARELDLSECSLLAGLLQSPGVYNPLQDLEAARWRQATVLGAMVQNGFIARQDAELAHAEKLQFAATPFSIEAPHFVSYVEGQLERLLGTDVVSQGGLRVTTTLDLDWNRQAEAIVRRRLEQVQTDPDAPHDRRIENAAVVAIDPHTGAIRTMVGSPDYFDASIAGAMNGAVALRQPGSAHQADYLRRSHGSKGRNGGRPLSLNCSHRDRRCASSLPYRRRRAVRPAELRHGLARPGQRPHRPGQFVQRAGR